jgi:hypothetical protein
MYVHVPQGRIRGIKGLCLSQAWDALNVAYTMTTQFKTEKVPLYIIRMNYNDIAFIFFNFVNYAILEIWLSAMSF